MSEFIDNRNQALDSEKVQQLKSIIIRLHQGEDPQEVKKSFREHFDSVDASEIIAMEQTLVDEGMDVMEIQKLCDIHADVFNGSIDEIHGLMGEMEQVGHPVSVMKASNVAIGLQLDTIENCVQAFEKEINPKTKIGLLMQINLLFDIDKHYSVKENCFFPLMEKYGFNAPPQVMWGVDDEIREDLKNFKTAVEDEASGIQDIFLALRKRIEDMIFKEEYILLPMIVDYFTEDEWLQIAHDTKEIGYCLVAPESVWKPKRKDFVTAYREDRAAEEAMRSNNLHFEIGHLNPEELEAIMNSLPIDMTFIDKDDTVKYFNQAPDRIFVRGKSVIGRLVQNCHPPKSVDTVETMLNDFKEGRSQSETFWIQMGGKFIHIAYYAIHNKEGDYIGTLEVSHDVQKYRDLEGEKRLKA